MESEPWLKDKRWANNHIVSFTRMQLIVSFVFLVIWSGICYLLYLKRESLIADASDEPLLWLILLFPITLIAIIYMTVREIRLWLTLGTMPLSMDPFPGSIGGHVGGVIHTRFSYDETLWAKVKLACVRTTITNSNNSSRRRDDIKWENDGICEIQPSTDGSEIRFRFDVDESLPPSDMERKKSYILWRLELTINDKIHRLYEIPVFRTAQSSQFIKSCTGDSDLTARHAGDELSRFAILSRGEMQSTIYFAPFKRPSKGLTLAFIGVVFGVVGVFIGLDGGPIIFPISFSLVGFGILLYGLMYLFKSLLITVTGDEVKSQRLYFGVSVSTQNMTNSDITKFELKQVGTLSSGTKTTVFYQLFLVDRHKNKLLLAERLTARSEAELVKQTIESMLKKDYEMVGG